MKYEIDVYKSLSSLFSLEVEHLAELPCYVFWKDKNGIYLGYNKYGANNLGYSDSNEIKGRSDHDIFPENIATFFISNDQEVMLNGMQKFIPEPGIVKNNHPVIFMSYKMPIYAQDESVIGVLGFAFTRPRIVSESLTEQSNHQLPDELAKNFNHSHPDFAEQLSPREVMCVQYLCKGLTLKQIAKQFNLSPRTVESYLERARSKMGCKNKAELMLSFIKIFGII